MTFGRHVPDASRPSSHSRRASASAGQVEEEVLGLDEGRRLAVDPAPRVDEVGRVELVAAVVALVAAGLAVAADRAGALDVAVGQGAPGRRRDGALGRLLDHVAVLPHLGEQLLRDGVVVRRRRARVEVVGAPEVGELGGDDRVVGVDELARGHPGLVGEDEDRRPVLVGPADHEDVVARHPHVPAEDVGRHTEPGDVAEVARAVGVRPGDGGEDLHAPNPRRRRQPRFAATGLGTVRGKPGRAQRLPAVTLVGGPGPSRPQTHGHRTRRCVDNAEDHRAARELGLAPRGEHPRAGPHHLAPPLRVPPPRPHARRAPGPRRDRGVGHPDRPRDRPGRRGRRHRLRHDRRPHPVRRRATSATGRWLRCGSRSSGPSRCPPARRTARSSPRRSRGSPSSRRWPPRRASTPTSGRAGGASSWARSAPATTSSRSPSTRRTGSGPSSTPGRGASATRSRSTTSRSPGASWTGGGSGSRTATSRTSSRAPTSSGRTSASCGGPSTTRCSTATR